MIPMSQEVIALLGVQSFLTPMKDRVHHQNQLTVMVQENETILFSTFISLEQPFLDRPLK